VSGELLPRLFTLACAFLKEPAVSFLWHFPSPQPRKLSGLRRPRILRGMLPYGVRTFLWRTLQLTSDHLPSAT